MKQRSLLISFLILLLTTLSFSQDVKKKEAIKIGDVAPDFTLSDQNGVQIKLSKAVKKSPVVLVFYRGYW